MCDPLLASRANTSMIKKYPKLLDRRAKQQTSTSQIEPTQRRNGQDYEIPPELLELKRNYYLIDQSKQK